MESSINNVYILTPSELTVIAAGKGIDGMFSLQEEQLQIDENMVCQALSHLYQQEFILNSEQEGFVLNEDLEKMITGISRAHAVILIRNFTQTAGLKILYVGNGLIALERSKVDANAIRLYEISREELKNFLEEDISNQEKQYKQVLDEKRLIDEMLENPFILQSWQLDSLGNAVAMLERLKLKKNKVDCRILIKQEKEERNLLCYKQGEQRLCISQEDTFMDTVENMIREAFDDIS